MKTIDTHIQGCKLITFPTFKDHRGEFYESWNNLTYINAGLPTKWDQDNVSISKAGAIRGLHLQSFEPQGKLVQAIKGKIIDVCLDLRPYSPTFGQHFKAELSDENRAALYAPPGCAHGFYSITDSIVYYKCTTTWDKRTDGGVNPFDPELGIEWPSNECIISEKDKNLPTLKQWQEAKNG